MAAYSRRFTHFCFKTKPVHSFITKNSVRECQPTTYVKSRCLCVSSNVDDGSSLLDFERTEVIESKDDFKYVQRLIPPLQIPEPPKHASYPTPCGWSPPTGPLSDCPYFVRRTRYHNIPVYTEIKHFGTQILTSITHIDGDIWVLANELKDHLQQFEEYTIPMQVHEYTKQIRYKGTFEKQVKKYLLEKGF
ncbi:large ribosomal subunit protein mL49-like isoform X2 [Antedon mediterranea]|uniref:large ribosomal subunit protein mL49-like isoform X2 n=1 Tax=Antedon mediterranea TaxID=105859 RepID=UPI003AF5E9F0